MAEPLEFRIFQFIQTAIAGISIAGGYYHNVVAEAVKLDPNHEVEKLGVESVLGDCRLRPFVVVELSPDNFEHFPSEQIRLLSPFQLYLVNDTDPEDDDSLLRTYYRLCADVETALAPDTAHGNLATDVVILSRQLRQRGQQVWAELSCTVRQNRPYGAPNG